MIELLIACWLLSGFLAWTHIYKCIINDPSEHIGNLTLTKIVLYSLMILCIMVGPLAFGGNYVSGIYD